MDHTFWKEQNTSFVIQRCVTRETVDIIVQRVQSTVENIDALDLNYTEQYRLVTE